MCWCGARSRELSSPPRESRSLELLLVASLWKFPWSVPATRNGERASRRLVRRWVNRSTLELCQSIAVERKCWVRPVTNANLVATLGEHDKKNIMFLRIWPFMEFGVRPAAELQICDSISPQVLLHGADSGQASFEQLASLNKSRNTRVHIGERPCISAQKEKFHLRKVGDRFHLFLSLALLVKVHDFFFQFEACPGIDRLVEKQLKCR